MCRCTHTLFNQFVAPWWFTLPLQAVLATLITALFLYMVQNDNDKKVVNPSSFPLEREAYDYMSFLKTDFLNKGQNGVDEISKEETAV